MAAQRTLNGSATVNSLLCYNNCCCHSRYPLSKIYLKCQHKSSRSTVHSQWRCHSRSFALSFKVLLRCYSRSLALLFEVPWCTAIRGPWGLNPWPKFSSLRGLKTPLTKTNNTTYHYYQKYEIWAIETNLCDYPLMRAESQILVHTKTFCRSSILAEYESHLHTLPKSR